MSNLAVFTEHCERSCYAGPAYSSAAQSDRAAPPGPDPTIHPLDPAIHPPAKMRQGQRPVTACRPIKRRTGGRKCPTPYRVHRPHADRQSLSRRIQYDPWRRSRRPCRQPRGRARRRRAGEVEDVILGCALPERATGGNIARQAAIRAGLPVTVPGMTVNRFCSSGLQAIALAAQRIIAGEASVIAAGGLESISLVQDGKSMPAHERLDRWSTSPQSTCR